MFILTSPPRSYSRSKASYEVVLRTLDEIPSITYLLASQLISSTEVIHS